MRLCKCFEPHSLFTMFPSLASIFLFALCCLTIPSIPFSLATPSVPVLEEQSQSRKRTNTFSLTLTFTCHHLPYTASLSFHSSGTKYFLAYTPDNHKLISRYLGTHTFPASLTRSTQWPKDPYSNAQVPVPFIVLVSRCIVYNDNKKSR